MKYKTADIKKIKKFILVPLLFLLAVCLFAACSGKKKNNAENDRTLVNNYDFDMTEYINVPDLKDIVVKNSDIEKEWQRAIMQVRFDSTAFEPVNDEAASVAMFDKVNINYALSGCEKTLGSSVKETLRDSSFDLIIGADNFIPSYESESDPDRRAKSFENQLIGAKAGDKLKVTVIFADDFVFADSDGNESMVLAGVMCEFDVDINSISRGEVPELDNSLVNRYTASKCTTVQEYRDYIYSYYTAQYAYDAFFNAVSLKSFPEDRLYEARLKYITDAIDENYKNVELDDEDIETLYDYYYEEADNYARKAVFERMVLEYLFKACNITMDYAEYRALLENDYNTSFQSYYLSYNVKTIEEYEEFLGRENLYLQYRYERMLLVLPGKVTILDD